MKYLISKFACVLLSDKIYDIVPYCKYCIVDNKTTHYLVFGHNGELPFVFDFNEHKNVLKIDYGFDTYYYLCADYINSFSTQIKFMSNTVTVNINKSLTILINGEQICDEKVKDISYSHYEIRKNYLVIYFKGSRDFVVIVKDKELKIASYYDEINIVADELIFMCKCYDSLEHGKVFMINKNNEYDSYLIYLNNSEKIFNQDFIPNAFLDCVVAGNYKYANKLLDDSIKLDDETKLRDFFADFDDYLPLQKAIALIKKNTLAGIYKFEITQSKISNIIRLDC